MPPRAAAKRTPVTGQLRLRTLGDASLDRIGHDAAAADHQEMSKALALVTYLACAPTRSASREHLIDLLWSDLDVDAAKHALRQHLWHLRRRFGEVLVAEGKIAVRLGAGLQFDRDDLLAAAERGQAERVVELYRGEFFVGFAAPGSSEFERWADVERARLRAVFIRCAEQLVRHWLSSGRMRDGQTLARRARDVEPMSQHGWRLLLEAHISGGDDLGARVEADAFEQLLQREEMEAEPASRALIAAAHRSVTRSGPESKAPFSDLVGRETEFAWLMQAWTSATEARATCVHIVASAGFGKTRLLQDFRARLASLRARVVVVRADAGSTNIPLSLVSDLVTALGAIPGAGGVTPEVAATLVGLAPSLASTYPAARIAQGPADEPHVRRLAIRDLIAAIAEERPLAVLIDDLHGSDSESATMLAGAFGAVGKQRLLVVIAQRPTGATPAFLGEAQQFTLAPLSESAIGALLVSIASLPSAPWSNNLASELRRVTGGSPMLVVETLQLALQRNVLVTVDGEWHCSGVRALAALLSEGGAVRQRLERLGTHECTVVSLLSIAQVPLPFDVLRHVSRQPVDELSAGLSSLERLGLVHHTDEYWQIGHDEYAAAALAQIAPDEAQALHAALGLALMGSAEASGRLRRLAPQHLRHGQEWDALRAMFVTFVGDSARKRDGRSLLALASGFLGGAASDDDAQRLVAMLPLEMRVGLVTPRRKAAALVCAIAAPLAGLWFALAPAARLTASPDQIALIGIRDQSGGMVIHELPLSARDLESDTPFDLARPGARAVHLRTTYNGRPTPSPTDRNQWLTVHAVPDSGTTDIFLTNAADGSEKRLTSSRGDDTAPIWSPDGAQIVFASARWSALGHTNIALMDLRSGQIQRLSEGDAMDESPWWSPDGSRIAFNRRHADGSVAICVVTIDGARLSCHDMPVGTSARGWRSDSTVLLDVVAGGAFELHELNAWSGENPRTGRIAGQPSLSPDGEWMLCRCRDARTGSSSPLVMRSGDSTRARQIILPGAQSSLPDLMWRPSPISHRIERVALSKGVGDPIVNVPYHLRAAAFGPTGASRGLPFRSFSVSDPGIASIDSNGVLTGRRLGRVTVHVSAGGWRRDSLVLTIQQNRRDTLAVENWKRGIGPSWFTFGEPRPLLAPDASGTPSFTTAGDGTFHSGAFSRLAFPLARGLTISTSLSMPITLGQWQDIELGLSGWIDTARVSLWNSRAGYLWGESRISEPSARCTFKYPAGTEGERYASELLVYGHTVEVRRASPPWLRTGRRTNLTLQLFPDGRCGAALNDVVIDVTGAAYAPPVPVRMLLMGNSYQTKVLVGPLVLTQGVDTTIAWEKSPH